MDGKLRGFRCGARGAGSRDRYATPRCVRVKTSGKGVQPFLLAVAGSRRRQRGKGWSLNRSRSP